MPTFLYALCWFVPLSGIAYVLSVFEIFPKQYHWLIGLVYIAAIGIAVWRIGSKIHRKAFHAGGRAKVHELAKKADSKTLSSSIYQEPYHKNSDRFSSYRK
jgi:hypothetical protein